MRTITLLVVFSFSLISSSYAEHFDEIQDRNITVKFEQGLKSAAEDIQRMIPSLEREIHGRTGLEFDFPFEILIYKNRDTFRTVVRNEMVAAIAVPERNLIVLDLSQMRVHPLNLELITMHEMTHLILHRHIERSNLPKWFNEGVSEWVSGISEIINPQKTDVLKKAVISGRLLSFAQISQAFPLNSSGFPLAYEQSRSMVEYIESEYGEGAIRGLISRLVKGMEFSEAVRRELSVDFYEIVKKWKKDLRVKYTWLGYVSNNIHWIVFIAGAIITIYGFIRLRKRIRDYPEDEEEIDTFNIQ